MVPPLPLLLGEGSVLPRTLLGREHSGGWRDLAEFPCARTGIGEYRDQLGNRPFQKYAPLVEQLSGSGVGLTHLLQSLLGSLQHPAGPLLQL